MFSFFTTLNLNWPSFLTLYPYENDLVTILSYLNAKEIQPIAVEGTIDFDDVSLRTDDLPRIDSLLVEILFLLIWVLYSIMRNEWYGLA